MAPLRPSKSALATVSLSILSLFASTTGATFATRDIVARDDSAVGCYSSSGNLSNQGPWTYQSIGYCKPICQKMNAAIFAMTNGNECWCGDSLPPSSSKTDDSDCSTGCQGFPSNICGGTGVWSVYLTGSKSLDQLSGSSSSSSAGASSTTNVVTTSVAPGQTIVVTASAAAPSNSSGSKSGGSTNTAGIAAGVVVGIVVAGALVGGIFFFLRRRRRQQADEEFRKQSQVSDFMRGAKESKPPSSGYSQMSDSRLDPVMNRRNSVGSLADEQDYSRKILRVANPDR